MAAEVGIGERTETLASFGSNPMVGLLASFFPATAMATSDAFDDDVAAIAAADAATAAFTFPELRLVGMGGLPGLKDSSPEGWELSSEVPPRVVPAEDDAEEVVSAASAIVGSVDAADAVCDTLRVAFRSEGVIFFSRYGSDVLGSKSKPEVSSRCHAFEPGAKEANANAPLRPPNERPPEGEVMAMGTELGANFVSSLVLMVVAAAAFAAAWRLRRQERPPLPSS